MLPIVVKAVPPNVTFIVVTVALPVVVCKHTDAKKSLLKPLDIYGYTVIVPLGLAGAEEEILVHESNAVTAA